MKEKLFLRNQSINAIYPNELNEFTIPNHENKRYFYQLEGEGIRYELIAFKKEIENGCDRGYIDKEISYTICNVIEDFYKQKDFIRIK